MARGANRSGDHATGGVDLFNPGGVIPTPGEAVGELLSKVEGDLAGTLNAP
jgi:hypothetical protein